MLSGGSTLVLKAVEMIGKRRIFVDLRDKKVGTSLEYAGKDSHARRVRVVGVIILADHIFAPCRL